MGPAETLASLMAAGRELDQRITYMVEENECVSGGMSKGGRYLH